MRRALALSFVPVFLTAAILTCAYACTACHVGCDVQTTASDEGARTVEAEYDAALVIEVKCAGITLGHGSGVMVSPTEALTAGHVVAFGNSCTYVAHTRDGDQHSMMLDVVVATVQLDGAMDGIGRLTMSALDVFDEYTAPPSVRAVPALGQWVCTVTGRPDRMRKCGEVQPVGDDGLVGVLAAFEPGNSGSGVYDTAGNLVGIALAMDPAFNNQIIKSGWVPIEPYTWLVPDTI